MWNKADIKAEKVQKFELWGLFLWKFHCTEQAHEREH